MKTELEDKFLEIIRGMEGSYGDYTPQNYSNAIEEWDELDDYPAVTVSVLRRRPDGEAIQERFYVWDCYIYIFSMNTTYDEATNVVETIAERTGTELEKYNVMESLTDNTTNERVYALELRDVDYQTEGFGDSYTGVSRMYVLAKTSKIGPF